MSGNREKAKDLLATALASLEASKAEDAVDATGEAIKLAPGYAAAIHVLGLTALQMDSALRAEELFRIAHDTAPDIREHCEALAIVSAKLGRLNDALFYGKLSPSLPHSADFPGLLPAWLGTYEDAMRSMDRSDRVDAGLSLMREGRYIEAVEDLRVGVETKTTDDRGWRALRDCLVMMDQPYEALLAGQALASIRKSSFEDMSAVAEILTHIGRFDEAQSCHIKAVQELPHSAAVRSALIRDLHVLPDIDPEDIRKSERLWEISFKPDSEHLLPREKPLEDGVLRVGILSGRMRGLQGMEAIWPAFAAHGRADVKAHVYSNNITDDALTRKIRGEVAGWTDINRVDDATAARIIRNDRIDVLIDLDGHGATGRMGIAGARPAPLVLSWFGLVDPDAVIHDGTINGEGILLKTGARVACSPFCFPSDVVLPPVSAGLPWMPIRAGISCPPRKLTDEFIAVLVRLCAANPTLRIVLNPVAVGGGPGLDAIEPKLDKAGILDRLDYSEPTENSAKTIDNFTANVDFVLDPGPDGDLQLAWETLTASCPILIRADGHPSNHAASALLRQTGLAEMAVADFEAMLARASDWISSAEKMNTVKEEMNRKIGDAFLLSKSNEASMGFVDALRKAAATRV
ncbi:glycosyltransferase family 41 protein [Hwanghaeella grinnelliae]|uniref:Glycosyltransferase family 41 protein n=1 Tax=Hwanghaeella grinnelliae TaxID=2500179 RepID=A0A3S2VRA6_9PROT|nr:glycosyltransferase family 41 protein [Hwanghaeella grinnelliae]RVU38544.1 glycosyltransferase family 41 protein [Hwanghaeella grinnelliae]